MPEVINLVSSPTSSPHARRQTASQGPHLEAPVIDVFSINSDDFKLLSSPHDLDFQAVRPGKKRRLSPPALELRNPNNISPTLSFLPSDGFEDIVAAASSQMSKSTVLGAGAKTAYLPSEPITFSSSAPEPRSVRRAVGRVFIDLESENADNGDLFNLSQPIAPPRSYLSERTTNLLANIARPKTIDDKNKNRTQSTRSKSLNVSTAFSKTPIRSAIDVDVLASSPPKPRTKSSRAPERDREKRDAEKAAATAKNKEEKEAEKERKRLAKEEKAREKQLAADIAEVNKSKTDKKNSAPEMILDMARSLEGTGVGNQVLEYMKLLEVDTTFFDDQLENSGSLSLPASKGNLVRWRRKVKAKYNEEVGHWEPIPREEVEAEKHILLHLTAEEFLEIAASGISPDAEPITREKAMVHNLDLHITRLRGRYQNCKPILLIEGMSIFLRKNKNAKNRAYTAAVRSQDPTSRELGDDLSSQPRRPRKKQQKKKTTTTATTTTTTTTSIDLSTIDEDLSETLLLHLQLHHRYLLIHHTATPALSAQWIRSFTEHISTIPYRHLRMSANDAVGFCMDVGQVKTGDDRMDTYIKMLQEVQRVTPSMAHGIANEYAGVGELVNAFRREGSGVLEHIQKSANRNGGVSERRLGKAISKRLSKVWLGRVEGCTDGIA